MNRKQSICITVIFCAFLGALCLISILLPKRTFSELENRNLQPEPRMSRNAITSGAFMEEAENYTSDHLAFRDQWVSIQSFIERLCGKLENGGTYFAKDGVLINQVEEPEPEEIDKQIAQLNRFVETVDVPLYFGIIPSAATVWNDKLPQGAPTAEEQAWIQYLYEQVNMTGIDLVSGLQNHAEEPIYYCTDHHWTSLGAFYGANSILEAMELPPLHLSDYDPVTVTEDFCGTTWSSACAWWVKPDSMEIYVPEDGVEVTSNFTGKDVPGQLYVPEKLETKNKYAFFLGGNQPLCVIRSETDGPRILVIRDSYSDSLAPFLSQRFSEVHLFDLRYNRSNVQEYIVENQIDTVLVLYSFQGFLDATELFQLVR